MLMLIGSLNLHYLSIFILLYFATLVSSGAVFYTIIPTITITPTFHRWPSSTGKLRVNWKGNHFLVPTAPYTHSYTHTFHRAPQTISLYLSVVLQCPGCRCGDRNRKLLDRTPKFAHRKPNVSRAWYPRCVWAWKLECDDGRGAQHSYFPFSSVTSPRNFLGLSKEV